MVYTAFICDESFEVQVEVADEMKRLRCCMHMSVGRHGSMRWRPFKTIDAINKVRVFKSEVEYQDAHVVLRLSETHEAMA
jgi:hypothetical protein